MKKRIAAIILMAIVAGTVLFGCGKESDNNETTPVIQTAGQNEKEYDNIDSSEISSTSSSSREKIVISDETLKAISDALNGKEHMKGEVIDLSDISLDDTKDSGFDSLIRLLGKYYVSFDKDSMKITFLKNIKYEISYDNEKIKIKTSYKEEK